MRETTGTFKVTIGGEAPYRDGDAVKLTRAYGSQEFSGGARRPPRRVRAQLVRHP